jgi:hypothetical protein
MSAGTGAARPRGAGLPVLGGGREVELARAGWVRRFTAAPPRLHEMSELYEALGLEVLHEPVTDDAFAGDCTGCAESAGLFRIIYTRESR